MLSNIAPNSFGINGVKDFTHINPHRTKIKPHPFGHDFLKFTSSVKRHRLHLFDKMNYLRAEPTRYRLVIHILWMKYEFFDECPLLSFFQPIG